MDDAQVQPFFNNASQALSNLDTEIRKTFNTPDEDDSNAYFFACQASKINY